MNRAKSRRVLVCKQSYVSKNIRTFSNLALLYVGFQAGVRPKHTAIFDGIEYRPLRGKTSYYKN